jgi:hypothetical protein
VRSKYHYEDTSLPRFAKSNLLSLQPVQASAAIIPLMITSSQISDSTFLRLQECRHVE